MLIFPLWIPVSLSIRPTFWGDGRLLPNIFYTSNISTRTGNTKTMFIWHILRTSFRKTTWVLRNVSLIPMSFSKPLTGTILSPCRIPLKGSTSTKKDTYTDKTFLYGRMVFCRPRKSRKVDRYGTMECLSVSRQRTGMVWTANIQFWRTTWIKFGLLSTTVKFYIATSYVWLQWNTFKTFTTIPILILRKVNIFL